jgi:hypothetical protein
MTANVRHVPEASSDRPDRWCLLPWHPRGKVEESECGLGGAVAYRKALIYSCVTAARPHKTSRKWTTPPLNSRRRPPGKAQIGGTVRKPLDRNYRVGQFCTSTAVGCAGAPCVIRPRCVRSSDRSFRDRATQADSAPLSQQVRVKRGMARHYCPQAEDLSGNFFGSVRHHL